jgi:4-carboxymuconolactone decarboxylase
MARRSAIDEVLVLDTGEGLIVFRDRRFANGDAEENHMSHPSTLAERALDVLSTLTGSDQTARSLSRNLQSSGALGEIGHYTGFGEIWGRTELSRRDRSLAVIAFQTAFGRLTELRFHIRGGLNHGLSIQEIDEVILQVATYVGAPAGLTGASVADEVIAEREGTDKRRTPPAPLVRKDPAKRRADGLDVLKTLLGHLRLAPKDIEARILATQGFMGELVMDWAFGDVWSRPQLSRRDRSFVVVSALAALNLKHELEIHLQGALNHGVTRAEIEEIMITLTLYGGFPRAIDGWILAQKVFERADAHAHS